MKVVFIFLLLIFTGTLTGFTQNLIPNPGFEEVTGCPGASVFLSNTKNWDRIKNHYGSPDQFYGDCAYNGIKNPIAKNQLPYEGKGYVGMFCYGDNLREYMIVELNEVLIKDSVYRLSFYILPSTGYGTMINSFGVHFSNNEIQGSGTTSLAVVSLEEHIGNDTSQIIQDTLQWTKIEGFYKARGGERFATFGNFKSDKQTKSKVIKPNAIRPDRSYMLVDGVSFQLKSISDDVVQKDTSLYDSSGKILLKQKLVFETEKGKLKIAIWDNQKNDGDIVTLKLNDSTIIDNYKIKKKKKKFVFDLDKGTYLLRTDAINLGSIPPNTCTIKIDDGTKVKTVNLNSNFLESEYVKIIVR